MINIEIYNEEYNVRYSLKIRNKFSLLVGNTATGKSTLYSLINTWNTYTRRGQISNTVVNSPIDVFATNELISLEKRKNSLFIFDEDIIPELKNNIEVLLKSPNYFLIMCREQLMLPYGVYDLLELSTTRRDGVVINSTIPKYISMTDEDVTPDLILTEDSSSGYKFFNDCLIVKCKSSKSKTRIIKSIRSEIQKGTSTILLIVDEVGFGYEFEKLIEFFNSLKSTGIDIYLWLPKSFEYVLLNSGMFTEIDDFLEDPYDSWDLSKYSTVEKYISAVLNREMKKKLGVRYSKGEDMLKYFKDYKLMIFNRNFTNYEKLLK